MAVHQCSEKDNIQNLLREDTKKAVVLAEVTTDMRMIKETTKRLENKFDAFVECAHSTYATKSELIKVESRLKDADDKQNKEISWNKTKLFEVAYKVATVAGIVYILINMTGCSM